MQKRKNTYPGNLNDLTVITKIAVLIFLTSFLGNCNSGHSIIEDKQVFLMGSTESFPMVITNAIKQSGIRKKGFVVIIPSQSDNNIKKANNIKQEFYRQEIMAVHILNLKLNKPLKKTEILAIENATIICLVNNANKQQNNKPLLEVSLKNAMNNNACLIVSNKKTEQTILLLKGKP